MKLQKLRYFKFNKIIKKIMKIKISKSKKKNKFKMKIS